MCAEQCSHIASTTRLQTQCSSALPAGMYGHHLHVWDWKEHKVIQSIDLGPEGMVPLELRFLHNPEATEGYVGAALSSNIFRFYKTQVCVCVCARMCVHLSVSLSISLCVFVLYVSIDAVHYMYCTTIDVNR